MKTTVSVSRKLIFFQTFYSQQVFRIDKNFSSGNSHYKNREIVAKRNTLVIFLVVESSCVKTAGEMPLRNLLRHLVYNEEVVERLSRMRPVRRLAQLIVAAVQQIRALGYENSEKLQRQTGVTSRIYSRFLRELEKEKAQQAQRMGKGNGDNGNR